MLCTRKPQNTRDPVRNLSTGQKSTPEGILGMIMVTKMAVVSTDVFLSAGLGAADGFLDFSAKPLFFRRGKRTRIEVATQGYRLA